MRVAFNARLLYDPTLRGWNRYTVNLIAELLSLGVEAFLYTDRPLHNDHLDRLSSGNRQVRVAPPMRYIWWEHRWLPHQCRIDDVELLHCPFNFGLPAFSHCPRVLTLHDAIGQGSGIESRRGQILPRLYHWIARKRAHHIITPSHHAKREITTRLGIAAPKVTVIYEAADLRFHQPTVPATIEHVRMRHDLSRPFVFYVGGWEKRKNLPFLLRAFAAAKETTIDLALAGQADETTRVALLELATALGIGSQLRLLGRVSDEDLAALYAAALCFVYPSVDEGFGLQLCEAMAAGCPVLAANKTSLPEVLGTGGELFEVADPRVLGNLIRRVALDLGYRQELVRRASNRSTDFSWRSAAAQTMEVYQRLLSSGQAERRQ